MIEVFCDGLCEPRNPFGVATYGFIIYEDGVLYEEWKVVGEGRGMSNNVAEYSALCSAFKYLLRKGLNGEDIIVKSDSKLLVNQMNGYWSCHGGLYVSKYLEACDLQRIFSKVRFQWIPREQNKEADILSRKAYEEHCHIKGVEPKYHNTQHTTLKSRG